jgi:hypothetical protein
MNPYSAVNGETTNAFGLAAIGGGAGASEFNVSNANVQYAAGGGGSGGGGSWSVNFPGGNGVTEQGNTGGFSATFDEAACGAGNIVFVGAGGGGAGSVGQNASCTKGGNGGSGRSSTVLGTVVAGGGGGSLRPFSRSITSVVRGLAGSGGGGIAGWGDGSAIDSTNGPGNGSANTGSGGGAGYSSAGVVGVGGAGGSGVVALRYITAAKPTYSKPSISYHNVGQTETYTTNVAQDSATAVLTRTFKWESTTPASNGSYTTLKVGTGAANAAYSWVPTDTSTTGSGYLYRLTVTDSDTAGLFITDSSTAYAVINQALKVTAPAAGTSLVKKINISRSETFTITLGTPTYRATLAPVIPGITIDTSTAGSVILRIGDTATVGTWLETLTVTDSVSAFVEIPLSITVSAPPSLLNSGEIVSNGMILNLDAGNSESLILGDATVATNQVWKDLSGNKISAETSGTFDNSRTCAAPTYYVENGGYLDFNGTNTCYRTPDLGMSVNKSFTVEAWFKMKSSSWGVSTSLITQNYPNANNINLVLGGASGTSNIRIGIYNGGWYYSATGFTPQQNVWNHILGTYDGQTMKLYANGVQIDTTTTTAGLTGGINNNGYVIGKSWGGGAWFTGSIATIRIYNRALTSVEALQNFNATKARFDSSNRNLLSPSQKYGSRTLESFTATSGFDTDTVTFAVGDRAGVDWDTATVLNQINLTIQESLTVGTYLDTVTVTDSLGQSTYLPLKMTVTKADTLTVYVDTPTALSYTGSRAQFNTTLKSIGAVGLESGTALSATLNFKPGGTTCATGGYCRVGDIGPAGGVIFIDTSTASSNGRIFEAAPQNWSGSDDLASVAQFCIGAAASSNISNGSQFGIGWGETLTANFDAGCTGGAAQVAADLSLNGYSDWFVPSENEAVQLYTYRNQVGLIQLGSNWSTGNWGYWTSTENSASVMRIISNASGWSIGNGDKNQSTKIMLRPVRSFKPCWAVDTCTSLSTTDTPTAAGLYNITPSALTNITDLLTKYTSVIYQPTSVTINKVAPAAITIPWINANYPETFTVNFTSTSGNQTIRYSTSNGTASGCTFDYKKIYTTTQGTCTVTITRAADRNFTADTTTATIFFLAFVNSQPTGQLGSGSTIALNGATSLETSTVLPPSITGFSTLTLSIGAGGTFTIIGTGFTGSIEVKFWRNKVYTATSGNGTTIEVPVASIGSIGATSGRILVTTSAGQAVSVDSLTITP